MNLTVKAVFGSNAYGENVICVETPRGERMVGVTDLRDMLTVVRTRTRDEILRSVRIWHPVPKWMTPAQTAAMHQLF